MFNQSILLIAGAAVVFFIILFSFVPVGLWVSAVAAGVRVSLTSLVAMRLRREPTLTDLCIIAMTGYGGASEKGKAKEAGFNHYLVKPVDLSKLLALLNDVSARAPRDTHFSTQSNLIEE